VGESAAAGCAVFAPVYSSLRRSFQFARLFCGGNAPVCAAFFAAAQQKTYTQNSAWIYTGRPPHIQRGHPQRPGRLSPRRQPGAASGFQNRSAINNPIRGARQ